MSLAGRLKRYTEVRRRLADLLDALPSGFDPMTVACALRNAGDELWVVPVRGRGDQQGDDGL